MNIKSTVYEDTIGIEFSPDDFHTMNLSPRAVISFSGGTCMLVPTETAIAMRDRLNDFFPTGTGRTRIRLAGRAERRRLLSHAAIRAAGQGCLQLA